MKPHSVPSALRLLIVFCLASAPSVWADKGLESTKRGHSDAIASRASATSSPNSVNSGISRKGLGFATGNFGGVSSAAFSFWADLDNFNSLQALLGFAQSDPLAFGVGGIYRRTIVGSQGQGLHAGGGIELGAAPKSARAVGGSSSAFYVSFAPIVGFHFALPGLSAVQLSLDGGPQFQIADGTFNFALGGLSSAMGLSVHYFF